MVSGQWSVVSGQWSVVSGQWSVVSGQWSVVSGHSSGEDMAGRRGKSRREEKGKQYRIREERSSKFREQDTTLGEGEVDGSGNSEGSYEVLLKGQGGLSDDLIVQPLQPPVLLRRW